MPEFSASVRKVDKADAKVRKIWDRLPLMYDAMSCFCYEVPNVSQNILSKKQNTY